MDELKKSFEEIAGDEAKEMAAAAVSKEESKEKKSDVSIKGDIS